MENKKPYHLMTPAERLAARIEQNRQIEERISRKPVSTSSTASRKAQSQSANQPSGSGTRVEVSGSFAIRKVGRS